MHRMLAILLLTTAPAVAWEAKSGPICELTHDGDAGHVSVTFDPAVPEYAIAITPGEPWAPGSVFAMRFDGPAALMISTTRHVITEDGGTLTVTDSGFGNVLNGLEFNVVATALLGDQAVSFSLEGAAPEVQAFRACSEGLNV